MTATTSRVRSGVRHATSPRPQDCASCRWCALGDWWIALVVAEELPHPLNLIALTCTDSSYQASKEIPKFRSLVSLPPGTCKIIS